MQGGSVPAYDLFAEVSSVGNLTQPIARNDNAHFNILDGVYGQTMGSQVNLDIERKDFTVCTGDTLDILASDGLQSQDSFGKWINRIITDSPGSVDDPVLQSSILSGDQQYTVSDHIFNITDIAPAWAFSTEKTKVFLLATFLCYCLLYFLWLVVIFQQTICRAPILTCTFHFLKIKIKNSRDKRLRP